MVVSELPAITKYVMPKSSCNFLIFDEIVAIEEFEFELFDVSSRFRVNT